MAQAEALTKADKARLVQVAYLRWKKDPLGEALWERWAIVNSHKKAEAEKYMASDSLTEEVLKKLDTEWSEQTCFITERFYSVTAVGAGDVYYVRHHGRGRADERISLRAIRDTLRNKFENNLILELLYLLEDIVPTCVAREYAPSEKPLFQIDYAQYANTWVPSQVRPSGNNVTERPPLWQEYLDRLMPQEHVCWFEDADGNRQTMTQQDYLEKWLAQRVRYPQTPNNVAIVLRGDFGTGKGVWLDELVSKLIGNYNYKSVSTKDWKGDFNADMFESVIIHLEETKDTRQNTGEMLKKLITQNRHRANEKNIPQRQVHKHFAIVITSNYPVPIVIDKGDRRYFVPVYSKHLHDDGEGIAGKNETGRFIQRFVDWLYHDGDTGFQIMRDWLEQVNIDEKGEGFRMPPDTSDKMEIWQEMRPYDSNEAEIGNFLLSKEDSKVAFSSTALAKHYGISDTDAQTILKRHKYVTKQIRLGKDDNGKTINARFWIPRKHADTKGWRKKDWTVWSSYGGNTDIGGTSYNPYDDEKPLDNHFSQGPSK